MAATSAAAADAYSENRSRYQDGKTKKATKSANAGSGLMTEVTWIFRSFATHDADDSGDKACTPVEPLWKREEGAEVVLLAVSCLCLHN